jgi:hypothetical protein
MIRMDSIDDTTLLLLVAPVALLELVGKIAALVSLGKTPPEAVRGHWGLWAALIVLVNLFGWIAWFLAGKKPR